MKHYRFSKNLLIVLFTVLLLRFSQEAGAQNRSPVLPHSLPINCVEHSLNQKISSVENHTGELEKYQAETVHAVDVQEGVHDGKRIVIEPKSEGDSWFSRAPNKYAPQGDTRWNYKALPECLRDFFGFKKISSSRYVIPDRRELVGAMQAFNALVSASSLTKINGSLYDEDNLYAEELGFLDRFEKKMLPVATKGAFFHHDMNFHSLYPVFVTERLDRHARSQVGFFLKFLDTLAIEHPELANSDAFKSVYRIMLRDVAKGVDLGSGAIPQGLAEGLGDRLDIANLDRLVSKGISPKEFLESRVNEGYFRTFYKDYEKHKDDFVPVLKALKKFSEKNKQNPMFTSKLAKVSPIEIKNEIQERLRLMELDCLQAVAKRRK